jgi:hypothetical protein
MSRASFSEGNEVEMVTPARAAAHLRSGFTQPAGDGQPQGGDARTSTASSALTEIHSEGQVETMPGKRAKLRLWDPVAVLDLDPALAS